VIDQKAIARKITAARTALVLDQPFFGVLALRLRLVEDPSQPTAWVDGRSLGYNPSFVEGLSHSGLVALIAHEVMHCACGHPWRRGQRDAQRWNVACDHAVNPILDDAGFTLPAGEKRVAEFRGKGAEWIYDRLPAPEQQDDQDDQEGAEGAEQGQDAGQDDPGDAPCELGEVRDAPAEASEDSATDGDWQAAVQQAARVAASQGKLGGGLDRFAESCAAPRVDWRSALHRWVQQTASADYAWSRPSTRYLARGLYLPALRSEAMGPLVVALDTSGSIDAVLLAQFEAELRSIVDEMQPARVVVLCCDTAIRARSEFEPGAPVELRPIGGGGTQFEPVFDAVAEMDEQPACVVFFTDLRPWSWPAEPEVPVLWAATQPGAAPFGEVLPMGS
jgi:predicted metal-dependent peptidase